MCRRRAESCTPAGLQPSTGEQYGTEEWFFHHPKFRDLARLTENLPFRQPLCAVSSSEIEMRSVTDMNHVTQLLRAAKLLRTGFSVAVRPWV